VKNSFGDIFMVLLFGALGWLMVKFDWQRPPLLLGLVLGGIAENNLFIASRIYGWSWLFHPGVMVITLIILTGMFYPVIAARIKLYRQAEDKPVFGAAEFKTVPVPLADRIARALFALFMVVFFGYVVYEAQFGFGAWEPRAALFPWVVGLPSLLLAILVFFKDAFQSKRKFRVEESLLQSEPEIDRSVARARTVSIVCWIVGFFLAIWAFGFVPASVVATFLYLKFGAGEKWPITVALTAGCWLFFYGVFDYALQLPFPQGTVFDWVNLPAHAVQAIFPR
jgi:hypothetical protein